MAPNKATRVFAQIEHRNSQGLNKILTGYEISAVWIQGGCRKVQRPRGGGEVNWWDDEFNELNDDDYEYTDEKATRRRPRAGRSE